MGMKQRKCPMCKKRRRYVEGHQKIGRRDEHGREDGWRMASAVGLVKLKPTLMICGHCAAKHGEKA